MTCGDFENLQTIESFEQCLADSDDAVVFHKAAGGSLHGVRDAFREFGRAHEFVGDEDRIAENGVGFRRKMRVQLDFGGAESGRGDRMGVDDGHYFWPFAVNVQMDSDFNAQRDAWREEFPIQRDDADAFGGQFTFVEFTCGNGDMSFRRAAGDVAAGGRGQAMPVEPLHEVGDLVAAGFELHDGSFEKLEKQ